MDRLGEAASALQALPIELPALRVGWRAVMHVDVFQALAGQVGAGVGNGTLRDQSASQRDVAHQLPGQRAPADRAGGTDPRDARPGA